MKQKKREAKRDRINQNLQRQRDISNIEMKHGVFTYGYIALIVRKKIIRKTIFYYHASFNVVELKI